MVQPLSLQSPARGELRSEYSSVNRIPGDIFDAGGRGGREAPSASSPCCSPEHRSNSVPQRHADLCRCFLARWSGICSVTFGSVCTVCFSISHSPDPQGRPGRRGRALLPALLSRNPRKKRIAVTLAYRLTNKSVRVCTHADIPGCVCTDTQENPHPSCL